MSAGKAIIALQKAVQEHTKVTEEFLDNARKDVNTMGNSIEEAVSTMGETVDEYIQNSREEYPFYRLTKNQGLTRSATSGAPDYWSSAGNVTYTIVETVRNAIEWQDRTALEKEVLTAMGSSETTHIYSPFNIMKMEWSDRSPVGYTLFQRCSSQVCSSAIAVCKILEGEIGEHWAHGATKDTFKITGTLYPRSPHMYTHCHPIRYLDTGSLLFALPCVVAGKHHFKNHGFYPYIGDSQNT